MRIRTLACVTLLAGLAAAPCFADCTLPPPPSRIPNGAKASEQEMLRAMQTLKQYDADVAEYLQCLDFEQRRGRLDSGAGTRRHNLAVDQLAKVAGEFNEQVRIFKSTHG